MAGSGGEAGLDTEYTHFLVAYAESGLKCWSYSHNWDSEAAEKYGRRRVLGAHFSKTHAERLVLTYDDGDTREADLERRAWVQKKK